MEKIKSSLLISLSLISTLIISGCFLFSGLQEKSEEVYGMVVPHHLIVEKDIDFYYQEISEKTKRKITRVILLSPNHFSLGNNYVQTSNSLELADKDFIKRITSTGVAVNQSSGFKYEHGIGVHLPFVKKYFPEAKIVPIILKNKTPEEKLKKLVDLISNEDLQNTLVIASIDFSHYMPEKLAKSYDEKTINWLKKISENNFKTKLNLSKLVDLSTPNYEANADAVSFDSPESLFVFLSLMNKSGAKAFNFHKRTSSAEIANLKEGILNTTHLFFSFSK